MAVNRYGVHVQAGTRPAAPPRRQRRVKDGGPYLADMVVVEVVGGRELYLRCYQHLHHVSVTLGVGRWGREEVIGRAECFGMSGQQEFNLRRSLMASALKALYQRMSNGQLGSSPKDNGFEGDYPALFDFLTVTELDGKARNPGTLSIFAQDGKFKGSLQDKETQHYCFVSADSFKGLLEAMEGALTQPEHEWRPSKPWGGNGKAKGR